jgi:cardiolipin synthase (CMP-forming)
MRSVLGTILDPAADKILMTTLVVTLTMKGLLPSAFSIHHPTASVYPFKSVVTLAVIVLGRDVLLSISALYIRYTSLPHPVSPDMLSAIGPSLFFRA